MGSLGWMAVAIALSLPAAGAPPMSAAEVGTLEDQLAVDAEDMDARARLLEFYFASGEMGEWARHELWLIEHHPESDLHRVAVGLNSEWVERLAAAWRKVPARSGEPVLISRVEPLYAEKSPAGVVKVQLSVDRDGRVSSAKVLSGPPSLVKAVTTAVVQWRFRPGVYQDVVVEVAFKPKQ